MRDLRRAPVQPVWILVRPRDEMWARMQAFLAGTWQGRKNRSPARVLVADVLAVIARHVAGPVVEPAGVWADFR